MSRTVSAWVTSGADVLGAVGPFPVDVPWWAEVEQVTEVLAEALGVPVLVLRLLTVEGGAGSRDGHVTCHVAASARPRPGALAQRPVDERLLDDLCGAGSPLRSSWARAEGVRELLDWAARTLAGAGGPVTGPVEQRRTWNLAGLFRLPTASGPVWLKATAPFATDEAAVIGTFARVDPGLVPAVLGAGEHRILLEHVPGEDCWGAAPATVAGVVRRCTAAQSALAPAGRPAGLRDWSAPVLAARVRELLAGPAAAELEPQEVAAARELTDRWAELGGCGLPDTVVHGDFHPGNWRGDGGTPVVVDFADAYWGHPVADGVRVLGFLPEAEREAAATAWIDAWSERVPGSDPARALLLAEPLAHLACAVRYQEFLDGIEESERRYHEGDPAASVRAAVRAARRPAPGLTAAAAAGRRGRTA
ncbi:aminoglycoside phosphotransferase, partial [Actinobacteria bacterium OK074]